MRAADQEGGGAAALAAKALQSEEPEEQGLTTRLLGRGGAEAPAAPRSFAEGGGDEAQPPCHPSISRRASHAAGADVQRRREGSFWDDPLAGLTQLAMLAQPSTAAAPVFDDGAEDTGV